MARYYRIFVEGFSSIKIPLTKLTRKVVKFSLNAKFVDSFNELKHQLITTLVLVIFNSTSGYAVYNNASHLNLGCIVIQHGKVVTYGSKQLRAHE